MKYKYGQVYRDRSDNEIVMSLGYDYDYGGDPDDHWPMVVVLVAGIPKAYPPDAQGEVLDRDLDNADSWEQIE